MTTNKLLIHVRFAADGGVTEIGERPPAVAPQAWFNTLSAALGTSYQPLANGRGVFRVTEAELTPLQPALG